MEIQLNLVKYDVYILILQQRKTGHFLIFYSMNRVNVDKMIYEIAYDVCNLAFSGTKTPKRNYVIIVIVPIFINMLFSYYSEFYIKNWRW